MVTLPAFGDIVEQGGQVQDFRVVNLLKNISGMGKIRTVFSVGKPAQVPDHEQYVLVHGIYMEKIKLHATDYVRKSRDKSRQDSVAIHPL